MQAVKKTSLFFSEGGSDKVYHAEIIPVEGGNVVNFRYGRRGSTLTCGSKTPTPVALEQAEKIYLKLVKEKTAKGYTTDVSGESYQGTENAGRKTDFVPQLCNTIGNTVGINENQGFAGQEKMDGERRGAHVENGIVTGMNRKGLSVPLPQSIEAEMLVLGEKGTTRVDGEQIGDMLYVFDLHFHMGDDIRQSLGWLERMRLAEQLLKGCKQIKAVPVAVTTAEKRALYDKVKAAGGEGLVYKRILSVSLEGRPSSGGDWLKHKFVETATCIVTGINTGKRSVQIGLMDSDNQNQLVSVGNVTIPANAKVPEVDTLLDVDYLYAYKKGSLYQPVYSMPRTDLDVDACVTSQLKYKPDGRPDDEDEDLVLQIV